MARQPWVYDVFHMRRTLEGASDEEGVHAVGLHAQCEGLSTPLGEPAVVRARHGADGVLEETKGIGVCGLVGGEDRRAHYDVRVAVYVFCEGVDDDVCAEEEGGGVEWGEEGVVYYDERVGGV